MNQASLLSVGRGSVFSKILRSLALWSPGLLVMLADTDVGNVVAAANGGALWDYRLLPLLVGLIPLLYMLQELALRLGVFTGRGYGDLVREYVGPRWFTLATISVVISAVGTIVTQLTGVAGIGEMFGLPRVVTLPAISGFLFAVMLSGSVCRVERMALFAGLFEMAFFVAAWLAHPSLTVMLKHAIDLPLGNHAFLFAAAALVGATFNPWMFFYQQAAASRSGSPSFCYRDLRWGAAVGAILTQCLTGAVMISVAAASSKNFLVGPIDTVGNIRSALNPALGECASRLVLSVGLLGAAVMAVMASSSVLAQGLNELRRRCLDAVPGLLRDIRARFYYALCLGGSVMLVLAVPDLIRLNLLLQVGNAIVLPLVIAPPLALATKALPKEGTLRPGHLLGLAIGVTVICLLGICGGMMALAEALESSHGSA